MKIHLIGPTGCGKSTFASLLSKRYKINHYDLDDIFWINDSQSYATKRSVEDRTLKLHAVIDQDSWITEGVYYAWISEITNNADVIFYIDIPRAVRIQRVIVRFLKRVFQKHNRDTFCSLIALIRWDKKHTVELASFYAILTKNQQNTYTIKNKKELLNIIEKHYTYSQPTKTH